MSTETEREGTVRDDEGNLVIPASQRPDGSWRKPRKVKDGYVPQEEVPIYENKGVQWMKNFTPPGLNFVDEKEKTNNGKKKKNKQKKKKSAVKEVIDDIKDFQIVELPNQNDNCKETETSECLDTAKKLRNLRKKLKQIESLESRIQSGDLTNPEKDQLEKISRKGDLLDEIDDLELELT